MQRMIQAYRRNAEQAEEGPEAEISRYAPMVYALVRQSAEQLPPSVDREDLFSAGMAGLLDAMRRFDPARGIAFEVYAQVRVRWAIQDELRGLDHLSRGMRRRTRAVHASQEEFVRAEGAPPSDVDVATRTGLSIEDVQRSLSLSRPPDAVDPSAIDSMGGGTVWAAPEGTLERMQWDERVATLSRAISELPERNRLVLGLYYEAELTLKEIGDILGVTQSRISQVLRKTENMLKARLAEEFADDAT